MSAREVAERLRKRKTIEELETPEGKIYLRALSGAERAEWISRHTDEKRTVNDQLLADQDIVAMALVDERGNPLYETKEEAFEVVCDYDIPAIVKPAAAIVSKLSGMDIKAGENAEKKSDASPNSSGGTGSPENSAPR